MCSLFQPLAGRFNLQINDTVRGQSIITTPAVEGTVFAVTMGNILISFNQNTPSAIITTTPIVGLQPGDQIVGIDFRPRTGQLFAVSQASFVYTINTMNGMATLVSPTPFTPALSGMSFGVDFNPTSDRIRVVSDATQNLRLNPNNGAVAAVDGNLTYAAGDPGSGVTPTIVGSAYTNNFSGATTTSLYGIDSNRDSLVLQGSLGGAPVSPNTGILTTVGSLGVDTNSNVGFDITFDGIAFASLTPSGSSSSILYTINLQTGTASPVGMIGSGLTVTALAVVVRVETIVALGVGNTLQIFNSGTPGTIASTTTITGLGASEVVVGIDFRPLTGQLYGVTNANRNVVINPLSGAATQVGAIFNAPRLVGGFFGFDFNPTSDRIRIVSTSGQNLRFNPNNGALAASDATLAFLAGDPNFSGKPIASGAAYTNNVAGARTTSLYLIDSGRNALLLQGSLNGSPISPNTGLCTTVGSLGIGAGDVLGFDIAGGSNAAFASITPEGTANNPSLYTINLATGAATLIGAIGSGAPVIDIAIAPRNVNIVFAMTSGNSMISFNAAQPSLLLSSTSISGASGSLVGEDFRTATGQLYTINTQGIVFVINPLNGAAMQVGGGSGQALAGTSFGFDFNPVPDRIRTTSDAAQNLRFNPNDGTLTAVDGPLAYAAGDPRAGQAGTIVGSAYNALVRGSTSITLYNIDSNFDSLVRQGSAGGSPISPNTGQLFTIGSLGVDTNGAVGFDINDQNMAFAALNVGGASQLYTVNLITGSTTLIGTIGNGQAISGIAIANAPSGIVPITTRLASLGFF